MEELKKEAIMVTIEGTEMIELNPASNMTGSLRRKKEDMGN